MRLILVPEDLRPEFQKKLADGGVVQRYSTRRISFEKFNKLAQAMLIFAGEGYYYAKDRNDSNIVHAPKRKKL